MAFVFFDKAGLWVWFHDSDKLYLQRSVSYQGAPPQGAPPQIAWSPDGKYLAIVGDDTRHQLQLCPYNAKPNTTDYYIFCPHKQITKLATSKGSVAVAVNATTGMSPIWSRMDLMRRYSGRKS